MQLVGNEMKGKDGEVAEVQISMRHFPQSSKPTANSISQQPSSQQPTRRQPVSQQSFCLAADSTREQLDTIEGLTEIPWIRDSFILGRARNRKGDKGNGKGFICINILHRLSSRGRFVRSRLTWSSCFVHEIMRSRKPS